LKVTVALLFLRSIARQKHIFSTRSLLHKVKLYSKSLLFQHHHNLIQSLFWFDRMTIFSCQLLIWSKALNCDDLTINFYLEVYLWKVRLFFLYYFFMVSPFKYHRILNLYRIWATFKRTTRSIWRTWRLSSLIHFMHPLPFLWRPCSMTIECYEWYKWHRTKSVNGRIMRPFTAPRKFPMAFSYNGVRGS
jgi:hypothetical protein